MAEYRQTPPETDEEWQRIWQAVDYAEKSFAVSGPVYAVVSNWKPWAIGIGLFMWLQRTEVLAALEVILGVAK